MSLPGWNFTGCAAEAPGAAGEPVSFNINVPDTILEDLSTRLARARFPPNQLEGAEDWSYGTELGYLKSLIEYWKNSYDWKKQEAYLNEFAHYKMCIGLINLHYIHEVSPRADAKPLLLVHGWPGSFYEFNRIIKRLANPETPTQPAFHVVVPSLPGYGFSSAPKARGFDVRKCGDTLNELMIYLGYKKYYAQGGDWGAIVCRSLGLNHPNTCAAIHINLCIAVPNMLNPVHILQLLEFSIFGSNFLTLSSTEASYIRDAQNFQKLETGYQAIQRTKPQTLGYGLTDSPVGLAGWIIEKFRTWSDCNGNVESRFSKDDLLTNIMIYWINGAITSSTRLYYETFKVGAATSDGDSFTAYCAVPTGVAVFPKELHKAPKSWAKSRYNIQHWTVMKSGGHFACLEEPEALLKDMREFFEMGKYIKVLSKL